MGDKAGVHLIISGRVQGVFFRAFTRETAVRHGLKGWVRNLFDGTVEAFFEGDKNSVEAAVAECYKGTPSSHVDHIDITWGQWSGDFESFSVRH
jgi:acylphosphatase